jgi:hypothetical protein
MFSVSREELAKTLGTQEAYEKSMRILRQTDIRSRCEPHKHDLFPVNFTYIGADEIVVWEERNSKGECLSVAEYYAEKFSYQVKELKMHEMYPLEILYVHSDLKFLFKTQ